MAGRVIFYVAWVLLAVLVAKIAKKKGQSAVAFFVLSLFLSPIVGLVVVAILRRNPVSRRGDQ